MAMTSITCAQCGAANPANASFCGKCGQRVSDRAPAPPQVKLSGKARSAFLICAVFFVIAALEVVAVALQPPGGDLLSFPMATFLLPFTLLGVVQAIWAMREISRSNGRLRGQSRATAALALAGLNVLAILSFMPVQSAARSRKFAGGYGDPSAVGSVRTINTSEVTYASTYPEVGFTCTLRELAGQGGSAQGAGLIDEQFASGRRVGYIFELSNCTGNPRRTYTVTATPEKPGTTGQRTYCSDQSGVIRFTIGSAENCVKSGQPLQ